jgi:hypothetical protein
MNTHDTALFAAILSAVDFIIIVFLGYRGRL